MSNNTKLLQGKEREDYISKRFPEYKLDNKRYKKIFLGYANNDKRVSNRIYLDPPSFDCGWYWGFGYLGNANCHYQINGLDKNINLYDAINNHFGDSLRVNESDKWTFAELMQTFYKLKEYAGLLHTGGSHLTSNPLKDNLKNSKEFERINTDLMPKLFNEIYLILNRYK